MRDIPVMNRAFTIILLMSLLAVTGVAQAGNKEEGGNRVYRYRITFKETILFCTLRLTKEDKIAGVQLQLE